MNNFVILIVLIICAVSAIERYPTMDRIVDQFFSGQREDNRRGMVPRAFTVTSQSDTRGVGHHFYGVQVYDGLPIYGTHSSIHVSSLHKYPRAVKSSMNMIDDLAKVPQRVTVDQDLVIDLLNVICGSLGIEDTVFNVVLHDSESAGEWKGIAHGPSGEISLTGKFSEGFLKVEEDISHIIYFTVNYHIPDRHMWRMFVSTEAREVLRKLDLVKSISYSVLPDDAADPDGVLGSTQSNPIKQVTIDIPSISSIASPDGWVFTNQTKGNNADVFLDKEPTEGLTPNTKDRRASMTSPGEFSYNIDFNGDPSTWEDASVVQLFYTVNYIHDIMYHFGFDERSGNFQVDNYGHGGQENDSVVVHAQFYTGINNAYMGTPEDGESPEMGMFLTVNSSPTDMIYSRDRCYIGVTPYGFGAETFDIEGSVSGISSKFFTCHSFDQDLTGTIAIVNRSDYCPIYYLSNIIQKAGASGLIVCNTGSSDYLYTPEPFDDENLGITIPIIFTHQSTCQDILSNPSGAIKLKLEETSIKRRDTAFSKDIVFHEYAHGISGRLIGGPSNAYCVGFNQETGSEGWSDFYALALLEDGQVRRTGTGAWAFGGNIRPDDYYPGNGFLYGTIPKYSSVHDIGFYWANFLWDFHLLVRDRFGYRPLVDIVDKPFDDSYVHQTEIVSNMVVHEDFELYPGWETESIVYDLNVTWLSDWYWSELGYLGIETPSYSYSCDRYNETSIRSITSIVYLYERKVDESLFLKLVQYHDTTDLPGYDGGNIKISVNKEPFQNINHLVFHSGTLINSDETNPLHPDSIFSGSSQTLLSTYFLLDDILNDGDEFQVRFDYGVDCCCGDSFWAIEELTIFQGILLNQPTTQHNEPFYQSLGTHSASPGNWMSLLLITEGMKFVECNPDFIESRDGILAASQSIFSEYPHNILYCLIWEAASGRGMGYNASAGSKDIGDETASFDTAPNCMKPIPVSDRFQIESHSEISYRLNITENDWLGTIPTSLHVERSPDHGDIVVDGDTLVYTPIDLCEDDIIGYQLVDSLGNRASSAVRITWNDDLCGDGNIVSSAVSLIWFCSISVLVLL
eukprot:TRINITY_DN3297_c0_g1_i2.p1 TRINITY_DN3297_c0_g1~~TRINITY_DN3297_c0_g1_i2.p1  ORF type:complete len:1078 (+),score=214.47 TRINITY_DN3297_c0_g1_i2:1285-4518(+)